MHRPAPRSALRPALAALPAAAIVAVLSIASAQAAVPAAYRIVDLGTNIHVLDMDGGGQLAAYGLRPTDPKGHEFPMVIAPDGQRAMLDGGPHGGVAHGVSGARAVGQVRKKAQGRQQAVLWPATDAAPVLLAVVPGTSSSLARRVTPDGVIYGTGGNAVTEKCLRWTGAGPGGGVVEVLAATCRVVDGNDTGQLALQLGSHVGTWRDGHAIDLGVLPGGSLSFPTGINALGHLSAYGTDAQGNNQPIWSDGQRLVVLPGLGGSSGQAQALNDLDEVAGMATDAAQQSHPFVYSGGQTVAIDGRIQGFAGWRIVDISVLANDGTLVVTGMFKGKVHAIRLVPL